MDRPPYQVVALIGESGVGKTTAGEHLIQQLPGWVGKSNSSYLYELIEGERQLPLGSISGNPKAQRQPDIKDAAARHAAVLLAESPRALLARSMDCDRPLLLEGARAIEELNFLRDLPKTLICKIIATRENRIRHIDEEAVLRADSDPYEAQVHFWPYAHELIENNGSLEGFLQQLDAFAERLRA